MNAFGFRVYGTHAIKRRRGYPVHVGKAGAGRKTGMARVSGALTAASQAARTGLDAAKSVPIAFPLLALAALGGVFGGTLYGLKGFGAGVGLGLLAGYGVSRLPDAVPNAA